MSFLKKIFSTTQKKDLSQGLYKTKNSFLSKITDFFGGSITIGAEVYEKLEEILITSDIGVQTAFKIIENIEKRLKTEGLSTITEVQMIDYLKHETLGILKQYDDEPTGNTSQKDKPHVMMIIGVNGAGKTTSIGKLAYLYAKEGKRVMLGAGDTFRAGAIEQLGIWSKRAKVDIVKQDRGSDSASVAFNTIQSANAKKTDVCIIDTAGRLHTQRNLMDELAKIKRVMHKAQPGSPHEVLLVIDGSTGQNAIQQAKQFQSLIGITGLIVTKLDGTARGGCVLGIVDEMQIPIRFIGIGESIEHLQPFDASLFVNTLFGQADD